MRFRRTLHRRGLGGQSAEPFAVRLPSAPPCGSGFSSSLRPRAGERVAWIGARAADERLHLSYRFSGGGEWEDVAESVRIVRLPCRFGGTRPYFICPGVVNGVFCGRRVAKLHGPGRYFSMPALLSTGA
jgi:hypothetical protein